MKSIRRQLTRETLATLALLLGAGLFAIGLTVRTLLDRAFDAALLAQAHAVGALTELEAGQIQFDFSADFLRGFGGLRARHFFELWTDGGRVVTRSPALGAADLAKPRAVRVGEPTFYDLALPNRRRGRAVYLTLRLREADGGAAAVKRHSLGIVLIMAADRGKLDETLSGLMAAVAGIGVLMIVAVLALVPRLLARGLSSLDHLGADAAKVDEHTLSFRFNLTGLPTELRPIAERLNELLARLEASFERERRFSADIAHELRTPLAELRSLLECALKWPESRDPSTDKEALEIARELEILVGRMLALARGERGGLTLTKESIAMRPFAAECWRVHEAPAEARRLNTRFAVADGTIDADRTLFRSILSNLYENAVSYSPAGSSIDVWGEVVDDGYRLHVANPAGDLSAEDIGRLFDRFWRKDASRSGGRHLGLGLSLASTFAEAMGWRLGAKLDAQERLVITLDIPVPVRRGRRA